MQHNINVSTPTSSEESRSELLRTIRAARTQRATGVVLKKYDLIVLGERDPQASRQSHTIGRR